MFEKTYIIAEAGSNHNGELSLAIELVHAAKESGANAIKFQYFSLTDLFSPKHYKETLNLPDNQWENEIKNISFKDSWHKKLHEISKKLGITYFSTPFSIEKIDKLDPYVPFYKVASGDITNIPLLKKIGSTGKGVFISTGASFITEIDNAVDTLKKFNLPFICVMHCIMLYPAPLNKLNLGFIKTLQDRYNVPIGFSDHSNGIEAAPIAVALGAKAIEKHFTLNKNMKGADHKNSLNPEEFKAFVKEIRKTELLINGKERAISEIEKKERVYARRSIYAAKNISRGEIITMDKITFLRPNIGISVDKVNEVIGKKAKTNILKGSPINFNIIE